MDRIRLAVVGVGNCASALIQGIHYYRNRSPEDAVGLMHWSIGGFTPGDIEVVAAFDVDGRKVGRDVSEAMFAPPNCTAVFQPDIPPAGVTVRMGRVLDGLSPHMLGLDPARTFVKAEAAEPGLEEVAAVLRAARAEVLVSYLPVGSEEAARFYADCALASGCAYVNCMPAFIVSDPAWAARFAAKRLPAVGDDVKSQLGATIVHRALTDLFHKRGLALDRTYQLNVGGNTDFLNMLNRERLVSKKVSKTEAVQAVAATRLSDENIHVGPSDWVPFQKDNKIAYIRMEGRLFGDVSMNLELRLSVEDSPNSAGVAIDAVRCCKLALVRGEGGPLVGVSAYLMKHPPEQFTDDVAYGLAEAFIAGPAGS